MSFSKKIIAGVAAVATLAALAPAVAMAEGNQNQNSAVSTQSDSTIVEVSFYAADGTFIQNVGNPKGTAFSLFSSSAKAPSIEGKTFTGWADSEGTMLKDTDQVSTNIAVHATYADTPAQDDNTQYTVSFYAGTDKLIQTVSYYAKDHFKFSTYAQASRHRPSKVRPSPAGASPPTTATSGRPEHRSDRQLARVRHVQGHSGFGR